MASSETTHLLKKKGTGVIEEDADKGQGKVKAAECCE